MAGWPPKRLNRWIPGAFFMLSGYLLFLPGEATAGCAHESPTVSHFEQLSHLGALSESANAPEPWKPCSGPQCKNGQGVPPGPMSMLTVVKFWALRDTPPHTHSGPGTILAICSAPSLPVTHAGTLFRPPRPAR